MTVSSMPPQWSSSTLSDATTIIRGVTYKKAQASNQPFTGSLAILRANNIQGGNVIAKDLVYVPSDLVKPHQRLLKGDIVVAMSSGSKAVVGKTARIKENFDGSFGAFCGVLRPVSKIIPTYLAWFTHSLEYRNRISSLSAGANINNLKPSHFDEIQIPLAPLDEQKAIADKLDTLLAQVENTKARLERIPQILKRFRQSVLAAAVSGRLTEEWRHRADLPEWEVIVLGNVIGNIDQGWSPKCHNEPTTDESWGVIKTSSVLPMIFAENENKKLPESLDVKPNLRVLPNDILTTRAGPRSRCGVTCYVSSTSKNLMICDKVYRYRVIEGKGSNKFLALQLNSPSVLEKIEALKTGISESGMNLTQKKFRQLNIKWPTAGEQTEIVRRVDQLFAHADRIEQQVKNALARVDNLTQSILAKAFRGELTEQWRKDNPELISGENSAEALLERIKAERAAIRSVKSSRRKANA